jgi:hypothetical protein
MAVTLSNSNLIESGYGHLPTEKPLLSRQEIAADEKDEKLAKYHLQ